jgi:hypothetical protein
MVAIYSGSSTWSPSPDLCLKCLQAIGRSLDQIDSFGCKYTIIYSDFHLIDLSSIEMFIVQEQLITPQLYLCSSLIFF